MIMEETEISDLHQFLAYSHFTDSAAADQHDQVHPFSSLFTPVKQDERDQHFILRYAAVGG